MPAALEKHADEILEGLNTGTESPEGGKDVEEADKEIPEGPGGSEEVQPKEGDGEVQGGEAEAGKDDPDDDGGGEEPKPVKTVPLAALSEERQKRQAVEAEIAELRKQHQPKEEPKEEPKTPEYVEDPEAYINHQVQQGEQRLSQLEQQLQQQTALANLQSSLGHNETEFVKENADYYSAVAYMREVAAENFRQMGATDEAAISAHVAQSELQLAAQVLQSGKSPAEFVYNMAKRYGYQAADPENKVTTPETDAAAEKLKNIADGQKKNKKGSGGTSPSLPEDGGGDPFESAQDEAFGHLKNRRARA